MINTERVTLQAPLSHLLGFGQDKGKGTRFIFSPETIRKKKKKDKIFEKPGPEPGHQKVKDYDA